MIDEYGRLRAATMDDVAALDAMLDACARTYLARPALPGEAGERLSQPDSRSVVVEWDGVSGFASCWLVSDELRCFARVHPGATGRGIGTALLGWLDDQVHDLGADLVTVTNWAGDATGPDLLRGRGFTELRYFLAMQVALSTLDTPTPTPAPTPAGVRLRTLDHDRDAGALLAAWRAAFVEHFGVTQVSDDQWWHDRRDDQTVTFDPALWLVAEPDAQPAPNAIVGFCLGRVVRDGDGDAGYVTDVGVVPAWRGRGLGHALLTRVLVEFRARGLARASLHVDADNLTGAIRLYRKAGMHPVPAFTIWGRQVGDRPA